MIGSGPIARGKALLARTLRDQATVTQTGAAYPCRVDSTMRRYREQGLPRFMYQPEWDIIFADRVPILQGQDIVVENDGTYRVLAVINPGTYEVYARCECVKTKDAAGNDLPAFGANTTVTFAKSAGSNAARIPDVPAFFDELTKEDMDLFGLDPMVRYKLIYSPSVHYADGSLPQANHVVYIPGMEQREDDTLRPLPITRPRKEWSVVPWMMTTLKESP